MYIYILIHNHGESLTGKTTAIRRVAVRESGVSRQSSASNLGHPLKTPVHHRVLSY